MWILLGNGNGTFGAPVNYGFAGVGGGPNSLALVDFSGDGKLDLAVATSRSNTVSVLLGNGNGTFAIAVNYTVGTAPSSVAVGDVNGDGKADLAVANNGSSNVSILLGDGPGTFLGGAVDYSTAAGPTSVVIGDVNGDGKPDLAVAATGSNPAAGTNAVSVLAGNGNGTFGAAVNYSVGINPSAVARQDLNGDGKPDLAVTNLSSNTVSILLNTSCRSGPVGDFNGDGSADIAVFRQQGGMWLCETSLPCSLERPGTFRCSATTTTTARPTSRSSARLPARGWCATSPTSSSAIRATSRCPATTTATARPTSRSTGR